MISPHKLSATRTIFDFRFLISDKLQFVVSAKGAANDDSDKLKFIGHFKSAIGNVPAGR